MTFVVFVLFLLFCSQGLLNYVIFQYFDYEHTCTWGKLFQKRVVSTELYIYVCIYYCAGCLQEGSYLIYVACAYAYKNYIQLESSWGDILAFFAVFYCFVCLRPVSCAKWCQCLWIIHSRLLLLLSLAYIFIIQMTNKCILMLR